MKTENTPISLPDNLLKIVKELSIKENRQDSKARSNAINSLKKFLIKTNDGSYTLKSEEENGISETMHTYHGAIEESFQKFVNPSNLQSKIRTQNKINIMDICSGLGYNAAAAVNLWETNNNNSKLKIDMIEISKEILTLILLIPSPIESHEIIKKAVEDKLVNEGYLSFKFIERIIPENLEINIHCEDVRDYIKSVNNHESQLMKESFINNTQLYDVIFLDPFSPNLAPELYTVDFFKNLRKIIKDDCLILTFTSAAPVRSALIEAGFNIGKGPSFGKKSGGTIASVSIESINQDLSFEDERMIALSDAGVPFRDPHLNLNSHLIKDERQGERISLRSKNKFPSLLKHRFTSLVKLMMRS